jgi:molybdopterin/thiamine biosynthesis adenylyltransferase
MLYRERDLNKAKVAVLHQRLQEANPFSEIDCLERKISDQNIVKIAQGADVLLADLNELQTAAVLNRAASKIKIPLILSWVREMRGFITTLNPSRGLCLECTSLPERTGQSKALLAPMSSIMGGLMALEALHILGGSGPVLLGRLFGYDGDLGHCLEEMVKRKTACLVCQGK